jgi:hypothetical protein
MRKEKLLTDTLKGLLAATVVIMAVPNMALAQAVGGGVDLGSAASNIMTADVGPLAPLISALFWIAGGVLMGAGALKLKEHAENPTQTPMRQGISRMAVGAALLTIPFFSQFVVNTLSNTAGSVGYTAFTAP